MDLIFQILFMLINAYAMALLLRFFMQWFRTNFYNPVAQTIVTLTNPVLVPLRRILPGFGGVDVASLVAALVISSVPLIVSVVLSPQSIEPVSFVVYSLVLLAKNILNMFFFLLIIRIVLSFVMMGNPYNNNPLIEIVFQLTQPLLAPIQRMLPTVGVLDFSPMVLFIIIYVFQDLLGKVAAMF